MKILPSILAADYLRLGEQIADAERGGADRFHIDVMDGMFVPNLSLGIPVVEAMRRGTKLPLEIHLMIERPERYTDAFIKAGGDLLILLGLGPDGHTASLFPHSAALADRTRWVASNWVEKFRTHRITMTFPVLNAAAEVLFLVAGEDKAWALKEVLKGSAPVSEIPARGVVPTSGKVTFLVDRAAAAGLGQST